MTDDSSFAERLTFQHVKAIGELTLKKDKWEKLKLEYKDLREKIIGLPLKLKHDFKVPIGSVGMFEGQLIHTNEIMVLLGDNWFTQCSAHQAAEIISHRIEVLERNLKEVNKEITFLDSRKQTTEKLSALDKADGTVDIKEESKGEAAKRTGKRWAAHKSSHNVKPRSVKKLDEKVVENSSGGGFRADEGDASVEKLFNRLDELEMEEKKNAMRTHEMKMQEANSNKTSHVRFEDGCQEEESEAGSEEGFVGQGQDNCIKFTHTKHAEGAASEDVSSEDESPADKSDQKFVSPADIYTHFMKPQSVDHEEKPLRSILKKERKHSMEGIKPRPILKHSPEHKSDASSGDEASVVASNDEPKPILKSGVDAISGTVIERDTNESRSKENTEVPKKKSVSRFKASRMKK